jgi:tetratricopeptide (TPR) repeat protein
MKKIVIIIFAFFFIFNLYANEKKLLIDETIKVKNKNKNIKLYFENDGFLYRTIIEIEDKKVFEYDAISIDFKIHDFTEDNNDEIAIMFAHGKGDLLDFYLFNVEENGSLKELLKLKDLYKGGFSIDKEKLKVFKAYPEYNYTPPHFYIRHEFDIAKTGFDKVKAFPDITEELNVILNYVFYLKRKNKIDDAIKELEKIVYKIELNKDNREKIEDSIKEYFNLLIFSENIEKAKEFYLKLKKEHKKEFKDLLDKFSYIENKDEKYIKLVSKKEKAINLFIEQEYKEVIKIYNEIINDLEKLEEKELLIEIKYRLALAYNEDNQKQKAKKLFEKIIKDYPNSDEASFSKEFINK